MRNRSIHCLFLAALLARASRASSSAVPGTAAAGTRAGGPNVILIVIDALRADHLGAYGYSRRTSPAIDRLAKQGVLFENAVAQSNWTLPSVASIMTSLYPSAHGADGFPQVPDWWDKLQRNDLVLSPGQRLDRSKPTLAALLRRHGYLTAGFVAGAFVAPAFGIDNGFDQYSFRFATWADIDQKNVFPWLEKNRGKKFFLYLHPIDVHDPYGMYGMISPYDRRWDPDYRGAFDGSRDVLDKINNGALRPSPRDVEHIAALYDGGIAFLDVQLGRLVRELRRDGLLDKTLLVITGDHGDGFMEHGHVRHGNTPYDELLKVPLIVRPPGGPRGLRIRTQVSLIDIFPTILDWLDLPIPTGIQGRSLRSTIRRGYGPDKAVFSEPFLPSERRDAAVLRTTDWKMVAAKRDELYDLRKDPAEKDNVAARFPRVTSALKAEIAAWRELNRTAASEAPSTPAPASLDWPTQQKLKAAGYLR